MELQLVDYFNYRQNVIVPNVSWGLFLHECDLLILTSFNYAYEVEIKISKSDLVKDSLKKHNHNSEKIKRLYFALPEKMQKYVDLVREDAGIIVVHPVDKFVSSDVRYGCELMREPKDNSNAVCFTDDERFHLLHLGCMRMWGIKKKLMELQRRKNEV
jgi:hypothetical protein